MNIRQLTLVLSILFLFFFQGANKSLAASGCCSWHGGVAYCDTSVGSYVCNDGSYSPSCGCAYIPPIPEFPLPMNATTKFISNPDETYDVEVRLDDINPSRYSVILSKFAGGDPGPLVDYNSPIFTFKNIYPGRWYMNVKKDVNNKWSTIVYWTISVPEWVAPTSTPTPTPSLMIYASDTNQSSDNSSSNVVGSLILFAILICGIFIAFKMLIWSIRYVKKHEWMVTILFWGFILGLIYISSLFSKNPSSPSAQTVEKYRCNCSKTCTQITTCAEAYYQLKTCGCSVRDGDGDGTPCENLCQ